MPRRIPRSTQPFHDLLAFALIAGLTLFGAARVGAQEVQNPVGPENASSSSNPEGLASLGSLPVPVINVQWQGMVTNGTYWPPDPHGAAGPSGIIAVVNTRVSYFNKFGGTTWGPVDMPSFWSSVGAGTEGIGDPRAIYDPGSGRFYVIMMEDKSSVLRAYVDLAVSKNSNPATSGTADWYFYRFEATETIGTTKYGVDYPGLGFDGNAVYLTYNKYSLPFNNPAQPPSFIHCQIFAFSKAAINAGTLTYTSTVTPDDPFGYSGFTLQPGSVYGTTTPGNIAYFGETVVTSTNTVRVWALTDPLGSHTLSSSIVTVPFHQGAAQDAPQLGTTYRISVARIGSRTQGNAFWYGGSLWFAHTAGGSQRAIAYYYKVNTNGFPSGTPTLSESGGIDGGAGVWTFQPAIGCNVNGDVCMVYSQSSASSYPSIMVASHGSAATSFSSPILLKASPSYYTPHLDTNGNPAPRWGDYATVSPDPINNTFWVSHEWVRSSAVEDWGTWWGSITVPATRWVPEGVALAIFPSAPFQPHIAPDGAGGAFAVWQNRSYNGLAAGLYLSRVTASGAIASGFPIQGFRFATVGDEYGQEIATDGAGGAFIAWHRYGSTGIVYLNRFTGSGAIASGWPSGGLVLSTNGLWPKLTPDGTGGVLVTWYENGSVVQRVTASGAIASGWPSAGVRLNSTQFAFPDLASDGASGAIVVWQAPSGLFVQRVTASGTIATGWPAGGLLVGVGNNQKIVSDGAGGAVISYNKYSSSWDIYATRVTGAGAFASGWSSAGVPVTAATGDQQDYAIAADGTGGLVAGWADGRVHQFDIYAQRILGTGARALGWPADGLGVVVDPYPFYYRSDVFAAPDGTGGIVITWDDLHNTTGCSGPIVGCDFDIYASRVNGWGVREPSFPATGKVVSSLLTVQQFPAVLLGAAGHAITVWEDNRPDNTYCQYCASSIYAQEISYDGVAPGTIPLSAGGGCYDHDIVAWIAPGDDGWTGQAQEYDLRSSPSVITESNFSSAARIIVNPPQPAGNEETVTVYGATCGVPKYFAIKARDESYNWSAMSNVESAQPGCPRPPVHCEDATSRPAPPDASGIPARPSFELAGPNPASGAAQFRLGVSLDRVGLMGRVMVFDVAGRAVRTVLNRPVVAGFMDVSWDGRSDAGARVRPGMYYVRLSLGPERITRAVLIR